jgi:aminopeptidase N
MAARGDIELSIRRDKRLHRFSLSLSCVGLLALLAGCAREQIVHTPAEVVGLPTAVRPVADLLTHEEAVRRKRQVGQVSYGLEIDLTSSSEFTGRAEIELTLLHDHHPLTIDFSGGEIEKLKVNGRPVEADYNGFFLSLPTGVLEVGDNVVEILFARPYSTDGTGLHRMTDPLDGRSYLYTFLWPSYANRLFPCFDQPDLKASYRLSVLAPDDWVVVSTTKETEVARADNGQGAFNLWSFPPSPLLSTYLYSLHAGPYRIWEASAGDIPLRLLARESLAERVRPELWFEYTRQGFDFYQRYFEVPYAFGKYDQILVPDATVGAMETAAAVTYREGFAHGDDPSRAQQESLAGVILHEMAHMWFGDLVTMEWWNGLWLSESFATYMTALAKAAATDFEDPWLGFYLGAKRSAYRADELVTTHPIEMPISDNASFYANWDSITYGKGASVLKQLAFLVGEETFRTGVESYLEQHAFGNATLVDFTTAIAEAAGQDLEQWAEEWLYEAGVNTLGVSVDCIDGRIERMAVDQAAPSEHPTLRRQRLEIALYDEAISGGAALPSILPLTISGERTEFEAAIGRSCPELVHLNHRDQGYAKVVLDRGTQTALAHRLGRLEDPLTRSMFWGALWDLTRDGRMPLTSFAILVMKNLQLESHQRIVDQVLDALVEDLELLLRLRPAADEELEAVGPQIESFLWSGVRTAPPAGDLHVTWLDHYLQAAHTAEGLDRLTELLSPSRADSVLVLDQARRWEAVIQLSSWGHRRAEELVRVEAERDRSYNGRQKAIAAAAARPDRETKRQWLDVFRQAESTVPFPSQRAAMAELFPPSQVDLQTELIGEILDPLPEMSRTRDPYFLHSYAYHLLAASCRSEAVEEFSRMMADPERLHATVRKDLLEARQATERCLASLVEGGPRGGRE